VIYYGLKQQPIKVGSSIKTAYRDLSFTLNDPGTWNTDQLLNLLWRKAGGIIESVTLRSTYHDPTTRQITHLYRIIINVVHANSNAGFGFLDTNVNQLMAEIEDEIDNTLNVTLRSRHTYHAS
jgi:hypothetical protein